MSKVEHFNPKGEFPLAGGRQGGCCPALATGWLCVRETVCCVARWRLLTTLGLLFFAPLIFSSQTRSSLLKSLPLQVPLAIVSSLSAMLFYCCINKYDIITMKSQNKLFINLADFSGCSPKHTSILALKVNLNPYNCYNNFAAFVFHITSQMLESKGREEWSRPKKVRLLILSQFIQCTGYEESILLAGLQ